MSTKLQSGERVRAYCKSEDPEVHVVVTNRRVLSWENYRRETEIAGFISTHMDPGGEKIVWVNRHTPRGIQHFEIDIGNCNAGDLRAEIAAAAKALEPEVADDVARWRVAEQRRVDELRKKVAERDRRRREAPPVRPTPAAPRPQPTPQPKPDPQSVENLTWNDLPPNFRDHAAYYRHFEVTPRDLGVAVQNVQRKGGWSCRGERIGRVCEMRAAIADRGACRALAVSALRTAIRTHREGQLWVRCQGHHVEMHFRGRIVSVTHGRNATTAFFRQRIDISQIPPP